MKEKLIKIGAFIVLLVLCTSLTFTIAGIL
jgi:hypothetical protein